MSSFPAAFSTDNLIRGLNWILSSQNTIGPKQYAVVTLSTYFPASNAGVAGPTGTVEASVRNLLAHNMIVIASANNQNGDACDTSPGRMSMNNVDPGVANDVITAGGTMIVNRPWNVTVTQDATAQIYEADRMRTPSGLGPYGTEPAYSSSQPVREARWICGAGDSAICSNATSTSTANPADTDSYRGYNAGSNAGRCVTLFAPAKNVIVAGHGAPTDYRDPRLRGIANGFEGVFRGNASGTSWSAPIVARIAARILETNGNLTPAQVRAKLLENSVASLDPSTLNTYDYNGLEITGTPNAVVRDGDINITTQPHSQPAATAGSTTLSVAAASLTAGAFTYQWYEVNAAFDFATYWSGAYSSTQIAGATASMYAAPASSVVKAYWVRVSNGCSTADSDIAVIVPRPPGAPANVQSSVAGGDVTVTWTSGSGAEKYEVQRKIAGQPWTRAGLVPNGMFTFTETPVAPGGMVVYRVLSVSGEAYLPTTNLASSAPSNNDFVNLGASAYEVIAQPPSYTFVKARHLIELRQAVNALADAIGVPLPFTAAQTELSSLQAQPVKAVDFTTLMEKANSVRTNALLDVGAAAFTQAPAMGGSIKRTHIEELRGALR